MDQTSFLPASCQEMDATSQSPHSPATGAHLQTIPDRGN